ncbi:MAG TPA: hypothetical protein DE036_07670 [Actinobacteria bacterium]|nr:hypothetical protein [Actinomycetota bacterium]
MPPKRNNPGPPPPVMTLKGALPILVAAGIFDLARLFFTMFWFFGPALAAIYCTYTASDVVGSLWGLTAAVCVGVAVKAGALVSAVTIPFSVVMADAVALFGFLVLALWILLRNARLLKIVASGMLYLGASFGVGAIPLVGGLIPAFTLTLWKLYRRQIKLEKAAYAKWEKENAAAQQQERNQRMTQATQQAQFVQARAGELAAADVY